MFNLNPDDAGKRGGGIWLWIRMDDTDLDAAYADIRAHGLTVREEIGDRFWRRPLLRIRRSARIRAGLQQGVAQALNETWRG